MKRTLILIISAILCCLHVVMMTMATTKQQATNDQQESGSVKEIATDKNVQGNNYRTILPFKESQARGVLQDNMANSYNGEDFEDGLLN